MQPAIKKLLVSSLLFAHFGAYVLQVALAPSITESIDSAVYVQNDT